MPSVAPRARTGASAASSTYSVSGRIRPVCSASGTNSSGGSRPRSGCCQRTSASTLCDAAVREHRLRLVVEDELALLDRAAQLADSAEPRGRVVVALGVVELDAGVRLLGDVHGDVGARSSVSTSSPCSGKSAMPMLASDVDARPSTSNGSLRAPSRAPRRARRAAVASETRGRSTPNSSPPSRATVSLSRRAPLQRSAERLEQEVAALVPERVVHVLEAVEVDEHHGQPAVSSRLPASSAWWTRSWNSVRFGSPVRPSWRAWWRFSSAWWRSRFDAPATMRNRARVEEPQPGEQEQIRGARVARDRGGDRLVREVHLERARGLRIPLEAERNVDLERLAELQVALVDVLSVVEVADAGAHLSRECLVEVVRRREPPPDRILRVRVDDPTVEVPDLDPRDLVPDGTVRERLVERALLLGREAVLEVRGRQMGKQADLGREDGDLRRVRKRALLDLLLQVVAKHDAERHDRHDADERELLEEARPPLQAWSLHPSHSLARVSEAARTFLRLPGKPCPPTRLR